MPVLPLQFIVAYYLLIFICALIISFSLIPFILRFARFWQLYDETGNARKIHKFRTPRLGGIAIYLATIITMLIFSIHDKTALSQYVVIASVLLFLLGIKDDLSDLSARTKLFAQFFIVLIVVIGGNIGVIDVNGYTKQWDWAYFFTVGISAILMLLIINSFNLIDGINGLAATMGIIVNGAFFTLFINCGAFELAAVAIIVAGAIAGFLPYNLNHVKTFMGDTGALLIGFISAILSFRFVVLNSAGIDNPGCFSNPLIVAVSTVIVPVFDMCRVCIIRIFNGKSPFTSDCNHIHHRMIRFGFNQLWATVILALINILCICLAYFFKGMSDFLLLSVILAVCIIFNCIISFGLYLKRNKLKLVLRST